MDLAVLLPLAALLALQSLLALLLGAMPKGVSSAVAGAVASLRKNPAANATAATTGVAVTVVALSAALQLAQGGGSFARLGDRAALALSVEELRALLAAALGGCNVVLHVSVRALADALVARDKAVLNLEVLRKQAAGVSAAYMSSAAAAPPREDGGGGRGGGSGGAAAQAQAQAQVQAAESRAAAAERRAEALQSQAKGLEREYDRLLAESDALKRRLAQSDPAFAAREGLAAPSGGASGAGIKKKEF